LLVVLLSVGLSGCASTPRAVATQKTAVGGGFVAVGTATAVIGAVGVGAALLTVPAEQRNFAMTGLLLPGVIGVGLVGLEIGTGAILLGIGGKELDQLETQDSQDGERRRTRSPKPEAEDWPDRKDKDEEDEDGPIAPRKRATSWDGGSAVPTEESADEP
jgi:hypothetical protein